MKDRGGNELEKKRKNYTGSERPLPTSMKDRGGNELEKKEETTQAV
jgi:hypothetical protein